MSRVRRRLAGALLLAAATAPAAAQTPLLTIGTGSIAGLYFPVGGIVAALWQSHADGVEVGVESTGGSTENLARVAAGDLAIGIARSDRLDEALRGAGVFDGGAPLADLRVLFTLYPEPVTVIARAGAGVATFADLAGKRVNLGPAGTVGRAMLDLLLDAWGWTEDDFAAATAIPPGEQVAALCAGAVDAVAFVAAHPTATVRQALDACDTVLVPITGDPVAGLLDAHPFLAEAVVPAGLYEGQDRAVPTVGPVAVMVADAALPDDAAYRLTRTLFENLAELRRAHPALVGMDPAAGQGEGLGAPIHPGALRYYRQAASGAAPAGGADR